MLDVFVTLQDATIYCKVDHQQCTLSVPFGAKIPVEKVTKIPGAGNSSNAAIGFARLGLGVGMVSTVGDDETGQMILSHWRKENIATHLVTRDKKHESNYSTVLSYQGERTILVYHQPYTYRLPELPKTNWIYYSSLGKGHERLETELLKYLKKNPTIRVTFNPGTHQLNRGLKALSPIIARCEIFIVNKEEAELLLGLGPTPVPELLERLFVTGAKTVIITDGKEGSYATDGEHTWHCPIFPGKEVERTGAGDSFATAFSYARFEHKTIPEALRYGTAQAWSVVQFIGPQAGLLSLKKIQNVLKKFPHVKAKTMS